jgi:hypothetical protein
MYLEHALRLRFVAWREQSAGAYFRCARGEDEVHRGEATEKATLGPVLLNRLTLKSKKRMVIDGPWTNHGRRHRKKALRYSVVYVLESGVTVEVGS